MGGTIAITLRTPEGKEYRMYRWTNSLPWFVKNMGFINKEQAHVDSYLEQYKQMQDDWEKHKDDERFEYPMTAVYAPFPGTLSPLGYGLVVIDMQNNCILSDQMYCHLDELVTATIAMDMIQNTPKEDSMYHAAKGFFAAGRATVTRVKKNKLTNKYEQIREPDVTFEQLIKAIEDERDNGIRNEYFSVEFDMSPYEITEYHGQNNINDVDRMKADIKKLEFVLTDEEEKNWEEWKKELESEQ